MSYRIAAYNIEHMRHLFSKGAIALGMDARISALGRVISAVAPDILGIVEASDKTAHHEQFLEATGLTALRYTLGKSTYKRKNQDLVFYFRPPFELVALDEHVDFYDQWIEDIDEDGIDEVCRFERRPLEARFVHTPSGAELLIMLIAIKSKGVFTVSDLIGHQHLALANRKRQYAQAKKIRERIDRLLENAPELQVVVMGDFNDEPGLDSFERLLGASSLETIMGSVFAPERILHNTLWHLNKDDATRKELWTTEYPDLIVQNLKKHKGWLDHILVSPNMLDEKAALRLVPRSGRIAEKNEDAYASSDHFMVYCDVTVRSDTNASE